MFIKEDSMSLEMVYDNNGVSYENGYFEFPVVSTVAASQVIVKRFGGPLVLCEVEVYGGRLFISKIF